MGDLQNGAKALDCCCSTTGSSEGARLTISQSLLQGGRVSDEVSIDDAQLVRRAIARRSRLASGHAAVHLCVQQRPYAAKAGGRRAKAHAIYNGPAISR